MSSYNIRCNLLIHGFIKQFGINNKGNLSVPDEIEKLILKFYLLDIEPEMVFDSFGMDKSRMAIISDTKAKCICNSVASSLRLKCQMPTIKNNVNSIKSIKWKVHITATELWPNGCYFIGVVPDKTIDFKLSAFNGLKKCIWYI